MRSAVGRALTIALVCLGLAGAALPSSAAVAWSPSPVRATGTAVERGFGAIPPTTRLEASAVVAQRGRTRLALPVAVDLSAKVPGIGDQGRVGSCAAWAIGYGILGWYAATQPHQGAPFAALSLYNQVNGGVDGGSRSTDIYRVLQNKGIVEQAVWTHGPTDYRSQPTAAEAADALRHRAAGGTYLFQGQSQGGAAQQAIQTALAEGRPVAIGLPIYTPFKYLNSADALMSAAKATGPLLGAHMVAAYGYDQTGVKIANSWGTGWGNGGWATLGWDFVGRYAFEASTPGAFLSGGQAPPTPAPVVTDVGPRGAATTGGTAAVIRGTNLGTDPTVAVVGGAGSYPATVTAASPTQITATLPAVPAEGAYRVVVTTSGGSSADGPSDDVTYVRPPEMAVASGARVRAATGSLVRVTGSGFGSSADVRAGRVTATVNGARVGLAWVSDAVLAVGVPGGTPGRSASIVVARLGVASAPVTVPYIASITSLTPAVGPSTGGTVVAIAGRGFAGSTWALTTADGSVVAQLPLVASLDRVSAGVLLQGDTRALVKMPAAPEAFLPVVLTFSPSQQLYPGATWAPTASGVFTYSDLG
jgi:hypothetical protein